MMPLTGIKVVELSTVVAAPTASRMLCAYGAEVIKVENLIGDEMRCAGDFEHVVCEDNKNPLFTIHNSNKRLIAIDLKSADGKRALLRLLSGADVLISNIRANSLRKLGLDYDTLHSRFPKLIYAHFSGFGPEGPVAANPGFDSTAFWLRSGPMADWQVPGSFPMLPTYAFGDMSTSTVLFSGILMALLGRGKTGKGTLVNTSLYASGIWCNAVAVVSSQFGKRLYPDPLRPAEPFSHYYRCADDQWIGIFSNEYTRERPKFARIFHMPELLDDPRYASIASLNETGAIEEAVKKLNAIFLTKTSGAWRSLLAAESVSCEVARHAIDVSSDEQALANHYVEKLDFADGVTAVMPCPPIHFSDFERKPYQPTGRIGEDTDAVLAEVGYSSDEIRAMREKNAIR